MTGAQVLAALGGSIIGFLVARLWVPAAIERAPTRLLRTNVDGQTVPAVLGLPLAAGALVGIGFVYTLDRLSDRDLTTTRAALACLVVLLVAGAAGYADDRRGDEVEQGFAGHLRAALSGRVTGGLVKIAGVGVAGAGAGLLLGGGWFTLECAALVGLGANLVNLLDRAPGRAAKAALVLATPLVVLGAGSWATAVAGVIGALAGCIVADLHARAMLGDAGANPLGGVLGLGLAVSLDRNGRLIALVLLLAANLASERWSFSRGIERVPWLKSLDHWGRN